MGTANRSKEFHDVCWKNLKDAGFPDRIEWMKHASEKYPYMDIERVGIYGFSAGGQNALSALIWHNDFYKAAVSLCGCHDNRMDKIWWNEQWMGYPIDESYSESSNVDNAWRMKGKLLIVAGEFDENVDPASSLQVVDALMKANKNFEQLYLPNRGHALGGKFERRRIADFMVKNLMQALAGNVRIHQFLAALPLLMELVPLSAVGLDHVNHRLEFRIQSGKSLEKEKEREEKITVLWQHFM